MQNNRNSINQKIAIYIFSHNRGKLLENCIKSTEVCASGFDVTVIDDFSDDEYTLQVLKKFSGKVEVIVMNPNDSEFGILGLHSNMNYAINDSLDKGNEYCLFMQDDMQMVRKITQNDIKNFEKFFEANENSIELNPCFLKLESRNSYDSTMYIDSSSKAYLRKLGKVHFAGYTDIGLFHVSRFSELFGSIHTRIDGVGKDEHTIQMIERYNNDIAEDKGIQVGFYVYPFYFQLPFPITSQTRNKKLYLELIKRIAGYGFYPSEYMTEKEVYKLYERDLSEKAYAEKWLNCPDLPKCNHWSVIGGNHALIARGGWRKFLGKILMRFERIGF
jgi:hypothetical protein